MYLVDSSVWIGHFRQSDAALVNALNADMVACHSHIIGELALGSIKDRSQVLAKLRTLPDIPPAREHEVHAMIEERKLFARGIGYVDCHLLAAALIEGGVRIWTHDKRMTTVTNELGIGAHPVN